MEIESLDKAISNIQFSIDESERRLARMNLTKQEIAWIKFKLGARDANAMLKRIAGHKKSQAESRKAGVIIPDIE